MWYQGSTLVIDDKIEDGQPIAEQLRALYVPHLFVHANEDCLSTLKDSGTPVQRVRVVIQDIHLISGIVPTKADYDFAADILDKLLAEDNGPWLMVTWSTWAGEDEMNHAQELFQHLQRELQSGKRPYNFVVLDKSRFTGGVEHGIVTSYEKMSVYQKDILATKLVDACESHTPAMDALLTWERNVANAASNTLAELHGLCGGVQENDDTLGRLLFELSSAEVGKSIDPDTAWPALVSILNTQLQDRVDKQSIRCDLTGYASSPAALDMEEWKRRVNRMLHFDVNAMASLGPGSVYRYASYLHALTARSKTKQHISFKDRLKFGRLVKYERIDAGWRHCFVHPKWKIEQLAFTGNEIKRSLTEPLQNASLKEASKLLFLEILDAAEYVVVDITPSCDFAQNKRRTVKLCGGVVIDITSVEKKSWEKIDKYLGGLQYLWKSCEFSVSLDSGAEERKLLVVNSLLFFSLPDSENIRQVLTEASVMKLREQITRDLTHWLGRQLSRPGYTTL